MSPIFTVLGDSNVRNHVTKTSRRANPSLSAAQIVPCGHLAIFADSIIKTRNESTVCIVSCITNFLTSVKGTNTPAHRVDPVLQEVQAVLQEVCAGNPDRTYMISPPMYRAAPTWYREGLSEILIQFAQVMHHEKPPNLHLLPSFASPELGPDGVHLTPFSGLEFVLHLFDSANDVLDSLEMSPEDKSLRTAASNRVLEDRVVVLEQDHRRLNKVVEHKIAIDSELADWRENERNEDCFIIHGLPKISGDLTGKDWQDQALRDVQGVMVTLMGKQMPIVFVQNVTNRNRVDAEIKYSVKMEDVATSKLIHKKFGMFFKGSVDRRPTALKKFDIKSRVTHETSIRVSLLKLMAQRYRDSNPGGKAQVIHYDPRPLIKITPPSSSSDRRTRSYNFVEAAKTFPSNFTASELDPILKRINPKLSGKLRSIFIVLSDDVYQKKSRDRVRGDRGERADRGERGDRGDCGDREDRGDRTNRGSRGSRSERGSRSDSDQDEEDMASGGRSPSPPPPVTAPGTASRSRGHKRGLPPSKGNAAKK